MKPSHCSSTRHTLFAEILGWCHLSTTLSHSHIHSHWVLYGSWPTGSHGLICQGISKPPLHTPSLPLLISFPSKHLSEQPEKKDIKGISAITKPPPPPRSVKVSPSLTNYSTSPYPRDPSDLRLSPISFLPFPPAIYRSDSPSTAGVNFSARLFFNPRHLCDSQ